MKMRFLCFALGVAGLLTGCPTIRPLDQTSQQNIRDFAPQAVASSTQFLRGAPVDLTTATQLILQGARQNPKLEKMLAKAPKNIDQVFSKIQPQGNPLKTSAAYQALSAQLGVQPQAGTNCGTSQPIDADGDGIPKLFNYTFDCQTTYGQYGASLTGKVFIQDTNDNDPASGYRVTLTNLTFIYTDSGLGYAIGLLTNSDNQVTVGIGGKYSVTQTFRFEGLEYNNGATNRLEYSTNGSLEFTPAANATAANRFAKGTLKFRMKLSFKYSKNGEQYQSDLEIIANNLQVDQSGCGAISMVNSGAIQFTDGKNTLTWTITGCGNGIWTYVPNA